MKILKYIKDFFSNLPSFNIYPTPPEIEFGDFETDRKALASDWEAIGNDFRNVMRKK